MPSAPSGDIYKLCGQGLFIRVRNNAGVCPVVCLCCDPVAECRHYRQYHRTQRAWNGPTDTSLPQVNTRQHFT